LVYQTLGQYEKSLREFREALRLAPNDVLNYGNLMTVLVNMNRAREAHATAAEAASKKLDSPDMRYAFVSAGVPASDDAGMAEQVNWSADRAGDEACCCTTRQTPRRIRAIEHGPGAVTASGSFREALRDARKEPQVAKRRRRCEKRCSERAEAKRYAGKRVKVVERKRRGICREPRP